MYVYIYYFSCIRLACMYTYTILAAYALCDEAQVPLLYITVCFSMYACMYIYTCIYTCIYTHTHCICRCVNVCVCVCVRARACVRACVRVRGITRRHGNAFHIKSGCVCACVCVCVCVCVSECIGYHKKTWQGFSNQVWIGIGTFATLNVMP